MVLQAIIKLYKVDSRHTIYLPKDFVNDSAFPFKPNEKLIAKIENRKLVIEKTSVTSIGKKGAGVQ